MHATEVEEDIHPDYSLGGHPPSLSADVLEREAQERVACQNRHILAEGLTNTTAVSAALNITRAQQSSRG